MGAVRGPILYHSVAVGASLLTCFDIFLVRRTV